MAGLGGSGCWAAYLLSLPHRHDRRQRVARLLEPHPWLSQRLQWMSAVDGRQLAMARLVPDFLSNRHSDDHQRLASVPRFDELGPAGISRNNDWLHMTPGAAGCALSHRAVWERIVAETRAAEGSDSAVLEWALVLEDDLLWVSDTLQADLLEAVLQLPDDWHLCYLGWHGHGILGLALGGPMPRAPVRLEAWCGDEPLGTFAYLVSVAGAAAMLAGDAVFPLDYQLDAQLNRAFQAGALNAYRCGVERCLFFSPPCQFLGDSDVQACWSADHDPALRAFKHGLHRRIAALDAGVPCARDPAWTAVFPNADAAALVARAVVPTPRRCVVYVIIDPGVKHDGRRAVIVKDLLASASTLYEYGKGQVPALIACIGTDTAFAELLLRRVRMEALPRAALLFQPGSLQDRLEEQWPGAGERSMEAVPLAHSVVLLSLLPLCVDEVLVASPGLVMAPSDFAAFFARKLARTTTACPERGEADAAVVAGAGALSGHGRDVVVELLALSPDESRAEVDEALARTIFDEIKTNPLASYCGVSSAVLPPPIDPRLFLFVGRSWVRVATWVRELLRIYIRLHDAATQPLGAKAGGTTVEAQAAEVMLGCLGPPLVTARSACGASTSALACLAIRSVLGLADLRVLVVPHARAGRVDVERAGAACMHHQTPASAAYRRGGVTWEPCD